LLTHLLLLLLGFFAHAIFVVPDASSLSLRLAQIHRSCFVAMAHRPHGEFVSMNSSKRELEGHHHTVTDRPAELRTEGALSWPLSVLAHAATPSSFIRVFVFLSTQLSNNPPRVDFSTPLRLIRLRDSCSPIFLSLHRFVFFSLVGCGIMCSLPFLFCGCYLCLRSMALARLLPKCFHLLFIQRSTNLRPVTVHNR
jgi:hypothetical protein